MRVSELNIGLLMYFAGENNIFALLVDAEHPEEMYELAPWSEIYPKLDQFLEVLDGGGSLLQKQRRFHEFTHEWGPNLLPPPERLQAFDVLVIIPHGDLHNIPFHTIWIKEWNNYLGLERPITYCSSATLFHHAVSRNTVRLNDLSNWNFDLVTGRHEGASATPKTCYAYGADLKTGKNEYYQTLAELFAQGFEQGKVVTGLPRSMFKNGDIDAICVICHGYFDGDNPNRSGLLVDRRTASLAHNGFRFRPNREVVFADLPFRDAPFEVQVETGYVPELMTLGEFRVQFETSAQLVALLGCSTGSGRIFSGDDFNSLAYLWLKTGAPSVLASLWELDFSFLSEFIPAFLENWLARRQPKCFAWQGALRSVLQRHPESEPYEWGVLVLLGDWL